MSSVQKIRKISFPTTHMNSNKIMGLGIFCRICYTFSICLGWFPSVYLAKAQKCFWALMLLVMVVTVAKKTCKQKHRKWFWCIFTFILTWLVLIETWWIWYCFGFSNNCLVSITVKTWWAQRALRIDGVPCWLANDHLGGVSKLNKSSPNILTEIIDRRP